MDAGMDEGMGDDAMEQGGPRAPPSPGQLPTCRKLLLLSSAQVILPDQDLFTV